MTRQTRAMRACFVAVLFGALATSVAGAAQAQVVEEVAIPQRIRLESGMTRAQAERQAVEDAMAEAVRRVAGVRVSGTELLVNADSAGRISSRYTASVRLDADGHVVGWTLERGRWITEKRGRQGSDLVYDAVVRVRVARDQGKRDDSFRLSIDGGPDRLQVRGATLAANDEVVLAVSATRDARLVIVALTGDSVTRLVPNTVQRDARVVAGMRSEWPSAEWRERGLHFRVALPADVPHRTEVLAAIALLDEVAWPRADGTAIPLAEFNRWLVAIPADRRAVAQRTVMVERRADDTQKQMQEFQ